MHPGSTGFAAPFESSLKEPDCEIRPLGARLPTIVMESGYSESKSTLYNDRDLWLLGGRGEVQAVVVIKWSTITGGRVNGVIELWNLDAAGNVQLRQSEVGFFSYSATNSTANSYQFFRPSSLNLPIQRNRPCVSPKANSSGRGFCQDRTPLRLPPCPSTGYAKLPVMHFDGTATCRRELSTC